MWYVKSLENLYNAVDGDFLRRHHYFNCYNTSAMLIVRVIEIFWNTNGLFVRNPRFWMDTT
jgi:hypothetical protein